MEPIKFPILSTLILFALAGLLAFYIPLPDPQAQSSIASKMF